MPPAIVDDVLVNLIGDEQKIATLAKLGDEKHFVPGKDLARGIVRTVEYQHPGGVVDDLLQLPSVQLPGAAREILPQGRVLRPQSKDSSLGGIHFVKGLQDDHPVPGLAKGPEHGRYTFCSPQGFEALHLVVGATDNGADAAPNQFVKGGFIGKPLGQIDRPVLNCQSGHEANDGFFCFHIFGPGLDLHPIK